MKICLETTKLIYIDADNIERNIHFDSCKDIGEKINHKKTIITFKLAIWNVEIFDESCYGLAPKIAEIKIFI